MSAPEVIPESKIIPETEPDNKSSSPPTLPARCFMDPPRADSSSARPWTVNLFAPPRTSKPITPLQPVDLSAPPWFLTPLAQPAFLVPPATPWSDVALPSPWTYGPSSATHTSHPSGYSAPPQSSGVPVVTLVSPRLLVLEALHWSPGPSVSPGLIGSALVSTAFSSTSVGHPHDSICQVSTMAPPWAYVLGFQLGVSLWLLLPLSSPWLLPPLSPHWILPLLSLPWFLWLYHVPALCSPPKPPLALLCWILLLLLGA